jgi:tetratricopeptide (TPR) repeat protein
MAIRKEQVLALLALATAVLVGNKYRSDPMPGPTYRPGKLEFKAAAVTATPLVAESAPAAGRRDFCTEPSETRPLPPRELDFPPRAALSLAALPLDPGPDLAHAWMLTTDGAQVDGVTLQSTADAGGAPADAPAQPQDAEQPQGGTQKDKEERAALLYDRIWVQDQPAPHFGMIETEGVDLFELEKKKGNLEGVVLKQREFKLSTQKVGPVIEFGKDKQTIVEIRLAGTLRNEITRRIRAVPAGPSPKERTALVTWLLDKARGDASVYDVALEQATAYVQQAPGDFDGLRLQQSVLRARGDVAAEFAMLEGLQGDKRESAFRYEGLGVLKARLCLYADAEQDLKRAVAIAPTDARPHAALAEFLRERHRSSEAVEAALRAEQTLGSVIDPVEQARIVRVLVACHLAMGDLANARAALKKLPVDQPQPYLEGCVLYAAGQPAQALGLFRQAAGSLDGPAALLGQAASLLRDGKWQEAYDTFARVFDQEPLLRHRAATGLALLCSRLSQYDPALVWIDRALEAEPRDAYAFYLRGRTLRLMGQLGAAEEALTTALRLRDDFGHAIAEMAAVQAAKSSDSRGVDNAAAALAARRYGDRAVALVQPPVVELYELQGKYAFEAAEPRRAQEAFERARDLAAAEPQKLFAKGALAVVDYRRGLVAEAQYALTNLVNDSGLGKEDPMKKWAEATLVEIDDHAQKEMLTDSFDRTEYGAIWIESKDGKCGASIADETLAFGPEQFSASGTGLPEVLMDRMSAVTHGKNFLAVRVTMQLGPKQSPTDSFAGLGIKGQRGGGNDLEVRVGIRNGKPRLSIEDGRDPAKESVAFPPITVDGFDPKAKHELELRVVPRGDAQSRNFTLLVSWNGVVVHRQDLKMLTASTQPELHTILFASGKRGDWVDVRFDDYRLERRKDK